MTAAPVSNDEATHLQDSSCVESRVFALIVAIDKYKNDQIPNLSGCENDGQNINAFLTKILHVPPSHIVFLTNEAATRHGIISNFETHLIQNTEIRKGDAMVFFYAGHGSRIAAPQRWLADSHLIETICPHDERTEDAEGNWIHGIPDRTIDGLMRKLAIHKGDNITAILDSCHSGGISRVPGQIRFLPPPSPPLPPPDNLDQDIWMWGLSSRTAYAVVPTGFLYKAMSSHVLLAACRQEEGALEAASANSKPCGAFTSSLIDTLRNCNISAVTYSRLLELLPPLPGQHPQCEGTNKDRFLFNSSVAEDRSKTFRVFKHQGDYKVEAGSIHGVIVGTEFAIQSHTEDIILVTVVVDAFQSTVKSKRENTLFDIPDGTRSVVSNWGKPMLRVRFHFHPPTGNLFSAVGANVCADVAVLREGRDALLLERLDPLIPRHANRLVEIKQEPISGVLDAVAHFNFHLYRHNGAHPLNQQVTVRLHRLKNENGVYNPTGDDLLAHDPEEVFSDVDAPYDMKEVKEAVISDMDAYYGLTLENHSQFRLFPYVFYFDPSDYSIQSWYLPPSSTMLPPLRPQGVQGQPSRLPVGYGASGTDTIEFSLPPGATSDSGFLKVFVSTTYVDMKIVKQPSPLHEPPHNGRTTRLPFNNIWDAWTFVLTCTVPPPR